MTTDKTPTEALAQLRHLYAQLKSQDGMSRTDRARIADGILSPAIAALEKWGQPVVAGDVDRADAVNLARNALTQYDCAITKKGVRVLAEAVLSMDSALTTPQPTHAQAGALPLTDEQIKTLMQAHRTAMLMTCKARVQECGEFAAIAQDLDWLCESFGIKVGQHGTA